MSELNLQYNDLKRITNLSNKSYTTIRLDKNYIRYLYFDSLPRTLKHLSVSQNDLTYLEMEQVFPFLETLNVEMNHLHTLHLLDDFMGLKTRNIQKCATGDPCSAVGVRAL